MQLETQIPTEFLQFSIHEHYVQDFKIGRLLSFAAEPC